VEPETRHPPGYILNHMKLIHTKYNSLHCQMIFQPPRMSKCFCNTFFSNILRLCTSSRESDHVSYSVDIWWPAAIRTDSLAEETYAPPVNSFRACSGLQHNRQSPNTNKSNNAHQYHSGFQKWPHLSTATYCIRSIHSKVTPVLN
jgi:hypothetical protein